MILTLTETRELAREQMQTDIARDPTEFVEWLGDDRADLLAQIMGALDNYNARRGVFSDEARRSQYVAFQINSIIDSAVYRFIESRLP